MERSSPVYQTYVKILERELVPAMGCTEPIAIAYCAAVARSVLGELPDRIHVEASIENMGGMSSHADQTGLLEWIGSYKKAPRKVFLVHGEVGRS